MKVKVIIEEIISQEFEVEVTDLDNAYKEIKEKYRKGELVLDDANLLETNLGIVDSNDQVEDWNKL